MVTLYFRSPFIPVAAVSPGKLPVVGVEGVALQHVGARPQKLPVQLGHRLGVLQVGVRGPEPDPDVAPPLQDHVVAAVADHDPLGKSLQQTFFRHISYKLSNRWPLLWLSCYPTVL